MGLNWKYINSSAGRGSRRNIKNNNELSELIIQKMWYFQPGCVVIHNKFGAGDIISSSPGREGISVVNFSGKIKKIINRYLSEVNNNDKQ